MEMRHEEDAKIKLYKASVRGCGSTLNTLFQKDSVCLRMETMPDEDDTMMLYEASWEGNLATLERLIQNNPLILDRVSLAPFSETPLHRSVSRGHFDFTRALLARKPQLAAELDSLRRSPLHLASAEGHTEIVRDLLYANDSAYLVRDQHGKIPLHYAAMRGRVEVVRALINAQPNSITREKLDNGETVLHLCVKHNHLEVLKLLMDFVRDDEEFLNLKGGVGEKSIFDLAVMLKQNETIRYLLSVPKVRAGANSMKRMLDVLEHYPRDFKCLGIEDIPTNIDSMENQNNLPKASPNGSAKSGSRKNYGDWLKDMSSALMIVATVIATMTIQPALNPPGGVWQQNTNTRTPGFICSENTTCLAGTAVLAYLSPPNATFSANFPTNSDWRLFLIYNTTSFLASLSMILLLISGLPIQNKVCTWLLVATMCITLTFLALSYVLVLFMLNNSGQMSSSVVHIYRNSVFAWVVLFGIVFLYSSFRFTKWIVAKLKKLISKVIKFVREERVAPSNI